MPSPDPCTSTVHPEHADTGDRFFRQPFPVSLLSHPPLHLEFVELDEVAEVRKRAVVREEVHVGKQVLRHASTVSAQLQHTEVQIEQSDAKDPL